MKLIDRGNKVKVVAATHDEINSLDKLLRVKSQNAKYTEAYRKKRWDGYFRYFDKRSKSFRRKSRACLIRRDLTEIASAEVVTARAIISDFLQGPQ